MQTTDVAQLAGITGLFSGLSIVVAGDLILDEFVWGKVDRISPEAPVPVVEVQKQSFRLGGAANVASNLAALGAVPKLVGIVGDDWAGQHLLSSLIDHGISVTGVVTASDRPTTVKTRIIAQHQQVCRTDRESRAPLSVSQRELVSEAYEQFLSRSAGVILSDYAKGVLDEEWTPKLIQRATGEGLFVAVDPKVSHFSIYRGASVVTPNQKEALQGAEALGIRVSSAEQAGQAILKAVEADSVLMTRGDQGMTLFEEKNEIQIPTVAQEVFDVTGAGDTVIAVLTLAMAAGATIHQSALLANYAAGVVVGKLGTATVSMEELLNHLTPAETPA